MSVLHTACAGPLPATQRGIDFERDAAAALQRLGTRAEVAEERLFVVGHSQGASFVPDLIDQGHATAGGVMVAAGHRGIEGILRLQHDTARDRLLTFGVPEAQVSRALAPVAALVEQVEAVGRGEPDGVEDAAFWQSWIALSEEAPSVARHLSLPVLVISGEYDWHVPPEETQAWAATLADSAEAVGHPMAVVPCVTHALNCVSSQSRRRSPQRTSAEKCILPSSTASFLFSTTRSRSREAGRVSARRRS